MNSEREKADILFDYGLPLQFCCHLIQLYTLLFLRVATLSISYIYILIQLLVKFMYFTAYISYKSLYPQIRF